MENLAFTQRQKLAAIVKPSDLQSKGLIVAPFTELNNTLQDMISIYVEHAVNTTCMSILNRIPEPIYGGFKDLNVFTPETYEEFLQMITKENCVENRDTIRTKVFKVLAGDTKLIDIAALPVYTASKKDTDAIDNIFATPYAQFSDTELWVIMEVTEYCHLSQVRKLIEFNVYIPQKYLLT